MSDFNLPEGWIEEALGELADQITKGTTPTTAGHSYKSEGIPFIKVENIDDHGINLKSVVQFIDENAHTELLRSQFQENDVLFSIAGTIGKTAIVKKEHLPANTNQAVAIIRGVTTFFEPIFLKLQLKEAALRIAKENARGGAMNNISLGDLKGVLVSLPPLAEQQQIAQKLDELLSQVDTLKTRLDAIPNILKRFRQSVLAAAVSGRLTENAEARKFKSLGEAGISVKTGPFGSALHKEEYVSGGIPLVNPMHINDGKITPSDHMSVTEKKFSELLAWELKPGDVILGRRGEMGRAAVVKPNSPRMLCGTGSMVLRGDDSVLPGYLCMILRSSVAIDYFNKDAVGSTMVNLNQKVIKALEVFFPPLEEQTEIVHRVEQLFAYADQVEQRVKDAQARVNHLTQSILAKAFRGELTADWRAQNPELISGENSAAALLERIKAEREATAKPKRKVKA